MTKQTPHHVRTWTLWLTSKAIPSGAKYVLLALLEFADHEGYTFPSQELLAEMTGQCERTIASNIDRLEQLKIITRKKQPKKGGGWHYLYRVCWDEVFEKLTPTPELWQACGKNVRDWLAERTGKNFRFEPEESSGSVEADPKNLRLRTRRICASGPEETSGELSQGTTQGTTQEEKGTQDSQSSPGSDGTLFDDDVPAKANGHGPMPEEFKTAWNGTPGIPTPIRSMGKDRRKALVARRSDKAWCQDWRAALELVPQRPFLCGQNDRAWKADADWFLRPGSVNAILEGKYASNGHRGNGQAESDIPSAEETRRQNERMRNGR